MISSIKSSYFNKMNRFTIGRNFFAMSFGNHHHHQTPIEVSPSSIYKSIVSEFSNSYSNTLSDISSKIFPHISIREAMNNIKKSMFVNQSSETNELVNDDDDSMWATSTLKRRRSKMNKHKLRKRRKLLQKNTKISRGK
jgi:hypothetical protein